MARRAAKVDGNQEEIVDALRTAGVLVTSLAPIGGGVSDLLCELPEATFLIECKMPGEKLNRLQKPWHAEHRWRNHIAYSVADALGIVLHYRSKERKNG